MERAAVYLWCNSFLAGAHLKQPGLLAPAGLYRAVFAPTEAANGGAGVLLSAFSVLRQPSFQPDPLNDRADILLAYCAIRWSEDFGWKWAAGRLLAAGRTVKVVAAYFIGGIMLALVLGSLGLRRTLRNKQVWSMFLLMVTPGIIYYLLVLGTRSSNYYSNWGTSLMSLVTKPIFYFQWLDRLDDLISRALFARCLRLISKPKMRLS